MTDFASNFQKLAKSCYRVAKEHGFWDQPRNYGEMLMLAVSELSECLEALRHGNPSSDKIPDFSSAEEEIADCIIRLLDMSHPRGWRIGEAILAKLAYNKTRPHKHGKEF